MHDWLINTHELAKRVFKQCQGKIHEVSQQRLETKDCRGLRS